MMSSDKTLPDTASSGPVQTSNTTSTTPISPRITTSDAPASEVPPASRSRSTVSIEKPTRSAAFYCGVLFSLLGMSLMLGGTFSDQWVVFSSAHDAAPNPVRLRLPSYFGPWKACRQNGQCDKPWDLVSGLDEDDFKLSHLLLSTAAVLNIGGLVTLLLKCWHLCINRRHWFMEKFNTFAIGEVLASTATILTTMSVFLMGQAKQKVILRHHQLEAIGEGFLITLIGILLVVVGVLLMVLSSAPSNYPGLSHHTYKFLLWLDNIRFMRHKSQASRDAYTNFNSETSRTSQIPISCITTASIMESVNAQIVAEDSSSDQQRPEDDFLLTNTRPDASEISHVVSKESQTDNDPPPISVSPNEIRVRNDRATKEWVSFNETEENGTKYFQTNIQAQSKSEYNQDVHESCVYFNQNDDISSAVSQDEDTVLGRVRLSFDGAEDDDNTDDVKTKAKIESGNVASYEESIPNRTSETQIVTEKQSNKRSILKNAKRYATDTFIRPFQSSDQKIKVENSYPGNNGIAVLKPVSG